MKDNFQTLSELANSIIPSLCPSCELRWVGNLPRKSSHHISLPFKSCPMEKLREAIQRTPVIDHHAHNLLIPSKIDAHDLRSMVSEATGVALDHSTSTLAHLRAIKQLAHVLKCDSTFEDVKKAIEVRRLEPDDAWAKLCFEGIETALIDDGLDPSDVQPYEWHDCLTRSKCKRIVRIERIAESIISKNLLAFRKQQSTNRRTFSSGIMNTFIEAIENAIADPGVAGFKSVICYRVGLAIPSWENDWTDKLMLMFDDQTLETFSRLEDTSLNPLFVHVTARTISELRSSKPLQFHTGLGDNDISLRLSNPSHLQPFIETYPKLNIVLLHASYPFTTEAGYLASVYENTFLDIGEVFPFVSQDGQERVIRDALDLCPSKKLLWSTDGHWFPETYLLAILQVREGLDRVLTEYVERGALSVEQAIEIVRDLLFTTSNELYKLDIPLVPLALNDVSLQIHRPLHDSWATNLALLEQFLGIHPSIKFLRLQWLDYTSTLRARIVPISRALKMFREKHFIGITKAVLGLLQTDNLCPGFSATGEYRLYPHFRSLCLASRAKHATVQCEFQEKNGQEVDICPRTVLRRQIERGIEKGINFLVGFEIEVVFVSREVVHGEYRYAEIPINEGGHAWSTARALQGDSLMDILESIAFQLEAAGIELQQFHPESSPGQYEFVLGPLPPLEAVDALLAAREIISLAAANAHMRATLHPKPFKMSCGSGAHIHISLTPEREWQSFYAGVLDSLKAMSAVLYSNAASFERVIDGAWAGSTWIAWGPQNRETPLRQIESSHFEIKCVDGLANPYLGLAAIIGSGLQSIADKTPLKLGPCLKDPSALSETERDALGIHQRFPRSVPEALAAFESSRPMTGALGESAVKTYIAMKKAEDKFLSVMDAKQKLRWLIERY